MLAGVVVPWPQGDRLPEGVGQKAQAAPIRELAGQPPYRLFFPLGFKQRVQNPSGSPGVQMLGFDRYLGLVEASNLGVKWARVPISWSEIEPANTTPERYSWANTDLMFRRAADAGLVPIVTVGGNPSWAAAYPGGPITPTLLSEFGQFVGALASRYGASPYGVKYWEFYNEPDNLDNVKYWWVGGLWGGHGAEYARMLEVASRAVKASDPEAKVVMGGLAYDWFSWEGGIFDSSFLEDVLRAGGGQYFDIMNFHYYPAYDYRWGNLVGKADHIREVLDKYNVGGKPLFCTEAGWWSNADAPPDRRLGPGSDEIQSRYVVKFNVLAMQARLDVLIWFTLMDSSWDARRWGLLREDRTPKPSYQAFQTLTRELSGARYVRSLTPAELGAGNVEGHLLQVAGGRGEKMVLWASPGKAETVRIEARELRVVDKYGGEARMRSQDSLQADGRVDLPVTEDPLYVEVVR